MKLPAHGCRELLGRRKETAVRHPPPGQSRMALGGPMYHENGMDSRGASARKRRYTLVQARTVTSPSSLTRYFAALTLVFLWRAVARRPLTSRGPSEIVALIDDDPARPRRKPRSSRCRPRGGS